LGYAGRPCGAEGGTKRCAPNYLRKWQPYFEQHGICGSGYGMDRGIPEDTLVEMEDGSLVPVSVLMPGDEIKSLSRDGDEILILEITDVNPVVIPVCAVNYKRADGTYGSSIVGDDSYINTMAPSESNTGTWRIPDLASSDGLAIGDKIRADGGNKWYEVVNINCDETVDGYDIKLYGGSPGSSTYPTYFIGEDKLVIMGDEGEGPYQPPQPVPEFSTIGILLALLAVTIGLGFLVIKKK
jgi:hypothetical protein